MYIGVIYIIMPYGRVIIIYIYIYIGNIHMMMGSIRYYINAALYLE